MTQSTTDDEHRTIKDKVRRWSGEPAGITKGWLFLSVVLGWVFLGCAIFAAVRTVQLDSRVTQERIQAAVEEQAVVCRETNRTMAAARTVALADITADRQIWEAVDGLLEDGIPEPARSVIFDGFAQRERRVDSTYTQIPCLTPEGR